MKEKIFAFWSINEALNLEKAIQDIDLFVDSGLDGVVFQPRNYSGPPTYLSQEYYDIVSQLIIYCKELKIDFWLYDENGWPSGTADGKVIEADPNLRKEWMELVMPQEELSYQAFKWYGGFSHKTEAQPSAICKDATELFIKIVYDGYKNGLTEEAFDYVTGFFSDETALPLNKNVPSVPWSDELAGMYQKRTTRILNDDLPALFFDDYLSKELTGKIRYVFWELCASLLGHNYYQPLTDWCKRHNKRFTAHLRGEENIALTVPFSGSAFQVLRFVDIPMIDALERKRTNQFYPRIASSLSAQFSDGNTFCEAMGGSGWGVEPNDVLQYYDWLSDCNVNISCLHQSHLRLKAQALRDWPPSIPKHLSWQPIFTEVLNEVKKIYQSKNSTSPVLLIVPVRKIMASYKAWELSQTNRHKGENQPKTLATELSKDVNKWVANIATRTKNLHIIDEKLFEETAVFCDDYIQVGNQIYKQAIAHQDCLFLEEILITKINRYKYKMKKNPEIPSLKILERENMIKKQGKWALQPTNQNILPFGENYFQKRILKKEILIESCNSLSLVTSDRIDGISINGKRLKIYPIDFKDHFLYSISKSSLKNGINQFEIKASAIEPQPMCWLKGDFYVGVVKKEKNETCFIALQTFIDRERKVVDFERLSDNGYPFIGSPIILTKDFFLEKCIEKGSLNFSLFEASGGKIYIDGKFVLDYWNHRELQQIPVLSAGKHTVKVILYPSTFNAYGPYRYLAGDHKVISPLQYQNRKNLMDPPDLPEMIQHNYLNYKNTGIGELMIFV